MRLHPDDPDDPRVFRVDLSGLGKGTLRVVFREAPDDRDAPRLLMAGMSLRKRPGLLNPRPWTTGVLAAGAVALAARRTAPRPP
jgi:hypothetical protein